jgi:putative Holliday junction resolvase
MRYLGIDYGGKRIGLAVSSENIAFPHSVVDNNANTVGIIRQIVEKEKIGGVVVGDTRTISGKENPITRSADAFVEQLKGEITIPVERVFEAMSSIEASRYAEKGDEHNDAAAAAVILQRYLDMRPHDTL